MDKKKIMKGINFVVFVLFTISFVFFSQFRDLNVMFNIIILFMVYTGLVSFSKYPENIPFFLFLVSFFTFLLGRMVVTNYFNYKEGYNGLLGTAFSNPDIVFKILILVFISLLFLSIGYIISLPINFKKKAINNLNKEIRLISKYFFIFSFIFRILVLVEMIQTSSSVGYYESFSTFSSSLPSVFRLLSEMYDISLFIFLGTMPTKKESLPWISCYVLDGILSMLSGRRSYFLLNIFIIVIYYFYREYDSRKKKGEKWINIRHFLIFIGSFPFLIIVLNIIGSFRGGNGYKSDGISASFLEFLYSQGISINVIGYTINFDKSLPNRNYSFGPIIEFFVTKILSRFGNINTNLYSGQNIFRALEGNLFSHTISYFIMPDLYLRGIGYGSSYIAELFKDFSYIGVVLGNIFYGVFFRNIFKLIQNVDAILKGIIFLMVRQLMFAPRSGFTNFLVAALSLPKVLCVVIILLISYIINQERVGRRGN